jgi:MFS family permease
LAITGVFAGHAGLALIYDALPPVLVQLAKHFGGGTRGEIVAQFASSLPYFGVMIAGLAAPFPIARWGTRNVLLVALVLFGLLGSAGALIYEAGLLLFTRFVLGLAVGTMVTCCISHVALNFDEVRRARMTGWLLAFGCLCGVLFILISGLVASRFDWRAPFYLHAVVTVIFLLPVLCMGRGTVPPRPDKRLLDLVRLKPVATVFAVAIILQALVGTFLIQLAFLVGGLPFGTPNAIALIFAMLGSAAAASSFSYARWLVHVSPAVIVAVGFGIVAVGTCIAAFASSFGVFSIAVLIFGTGSAMTQAALFTWAMRRSPPDLVTYAIGFLFTCLYFGTASGPAAAARLPGMLGIRNLFLLIVVSIVVGLIIVGLLTCLQWRRRKQRS